MLVKYKVLYFYFNYDIFFFMIFYSNYVRILILKAVFEIKEKYLLDKDKDKFFTKNRNITSLKIKIYANLNSEKEPDYDFIF
ncbi:hypothetical protein BpHYR1_003345 [Brachionus plicatilis]|uniref:Uncharacterized protein n=1 Tax=Brachionus plicatilis TaxID=10195 RepID=A0A3M7R951_BRAPC|nr:hypothetical protein BpHYR1_003345 [Brachionus plicatilis]